MEFRIRAQLVPLGMRSSSLLSTRVHVFKLEAEEEREDKRKAQLAETSEEVSSPQIAREFSEALSQTSGQSAPEIRWIPFSIAA